MNRRELLAATSTLIATAALSDYALAAVEDSETIKRIVETYYDLYSRHFDRQEYREMLTDDYLLLENGEIMDAGADLAAMPKPEDEYRRTDRFDFRSIRIATDTAYAIYFLDSEISDKAKGTRTRRWLESMILRRTGNSWQVALLHSTRIPN